MNAYPALKYLKYKLFSRHKRGHGIHSPFIFNLIETVFRNKTGKDIVLKIEDVRQRMLKDDTTVSVTDLGSGSKHFKGNLRKVSDIAKYSSVPGKYGLLLRALAAEFGNGKIIELGTSLGISAMYLASGSMNNKVITIEGCGEIADVAMKYIESSGISNIEILRGPFSEKLPLLKESNIKPGLVFIDGDHRGEALRKNFTCLAELSGRNTVVVIDDINSSREMNEAWNWIKTHANVTLTVDIFRMGLVFFRTGVTRTDYIIRY